jgi:hypothetical protein
MLSAVRRLVGWRWYATLVFATWVLAPEARRLVDWETSFHPFSIFLVLPLMSLLPAALVFVTSWSRVGAAYRNVSRLWFLAFGYAYLIAYLSGNAFSALYSVAIFIVPLLIGIVLAASPDEDMQTVYDRNAQSILWLAVITGIYGIYQYISPPPWDVYWAQQANVESGQGVTAAFNFRIFGTLTSTGPLSNFLDFAIMLNVPRLRLSRWWMGLMLVPPVIALVLTEVRAEWLALGLGIVVFSLLSPRRVSVLVTLGGVAVAFVFIGSILLTLVNSEGANTTVYNLSKRISTFGAIGNDASALSRQDQTDEAVTEGMSEPLGQGLGASGGSTKLAGGAGTAVDNGFAARFNEMGFVGFILYELALLTGMIMTFRTYRRYIRGGNVAAANYAAMAVAAQVVLFITEIDADHHSAFAALFFWFALFIGSGFSAPSGLRVPSNRKREAIVLTPSRA